MSMSAEICGDLWCVNCTVLQAELEYCVPAKRSRRDSEDTEEESNNTIDMDNSSEVNIDMDNSSEVNIDMDNSSEVIIDMENSSQV